MKHLKITTFPITVLAIVVAAVLNISSSYFVQRANFGGCLFKMNYKGMQDNLNTWSECKNRSMASTASIRKETGAATMKKEFCYLKCILESYEIFSSDNKYNSEAVKTFYVDHTNATSKQIVKLVSLHDECNSVAKIELDVMRKKGTKDSIANCRFYDNFAICVATTFRRWTNATLTQENLC
ncbi:unnamed protein product [Orchesella dallaii]|uniref:Uncharacterized protein n=1 Tax=Orchesella dallaii TaxID=48710 RepID=A0ABP1RHK6_9HEXA